MVGSVSYTPREVGKILKVSRDTVAGWIRSGELPAFDVSKSRGGRPYYRVSQESLDLFVQKRSVTPPVRQVRAPAIPDRVVKKFY